MEVLGEEREGIGAVSSETIFALRRFLCLQTQAEVDVRSCCLSEIKQTEEKYTETLESIEKVSKCMFFNMKNNEIVATPGSFFPKAVALSPSARAAAFSPALKPLFALSLFSSVFPESSEEIHLCC